MESFSQDPIGFAGGDANLYRYVGNRPINAIDPSGLVDELPDREQGHKKKKGTKGDPEKHSAAERARRLQQQNAIRRRAAEAKNDAILQALGGIDDACERLETRRKTAERKMLRGSGNALQYKKEMEALSEAIDRLREVEIIVEDSEIVDVSNLEDLPKEALEELTREGSKRRWLIQLSRSGGRIVGKVLIPLGAVGYGLSAKTGYAGEGRHEEGGIVGAFVEVGKDFTCAEEIENYIFKPTIQGTGSFFDWFFGWSDGERKRTKLIEDLTK